MKTIEDVCIESSFKTEDHCRKIGVPFDQGSFFMGYISAVTDVASGKLPQVDLASALHSHEELVKQAKKKQR